ncbi:unnamed protein product [Phaedon cochleariae]|uniref:BTB domain-containing protein n=1 Tax=Phaedon cochleariae TaxID=80249 RepID=A0A9P0GPP0_PHACE|nr:unnamed protein product [Phaedon cochleariae]
MNKISHSKARYCIQSEQHPFQTSLGLCSLMEHQSLVDIAVCCGNNILHAHKIVLAASSPLFREELERNPGIEQVIISGCEFTVIRCLIEFMYCGETVIPDDLVRYLVAAAKLFQMKSLENLSMDCQFTSGELLVLPKPQFLSKKPKYPVYPFTPNATLNSTPKPPNYTLNSLYKPVKPKRKYRFEAEHQACVKEAQASILAIANLKKEIASAPQANTFIIEETCTETTVENFIPHAENQNFVEMDFNNLSNPVVNLSSEGAKSNVIQLTLQNGLQGLTADKIKTILGNDTNANVEIMFKTSDGNFVTVTDEVLQNLQKDGLQYQVIDEDGRMGEIQELKLLAKEHLEKNQKARSLLTGENVPGPSSTFSYLSEGSIDMSSRTLTGSSHGDDPADMVDLNNREVSISLPDVKPLFGVGSSHIPDGFEVVPNFFPAGVSGDDRGEVSSNPGLKFSPDMFFADHDVGSGESDQNQGACLDAVNVNE